MPDSHPNSPDRDIPLGEPIAMNDRVEVYAGQAVCAILRTTTPGNYRLSLAFIDAENQFNAFDYDLPLSQIIGLTNFYSASGLAVEHTYRAEDIPEVAPLESE